MATNKRSTMVIAVLLAVIGGAGLLFLLQPARVINLIPFKARQNVGQESTTERVGGGKPQPVDFARYTGGSQGFYLIAKQTIWLDGTHPDPDHIVTNPTVDPRYTWDINEHAEYQASGVLPPGGSTTQTSYHIWDWAMGGRSNWVGLQVLAPSTDLDVTLCLQPQGRCFTPAFRDLGDASRRYGANICAQVLYDGTDPAIVEIVGSNGGRGAPSMITRTVTNPTARTVKDVQINWGLSSDVSSTFGCPRYPWMDRSAPDWVIQQDYPFKWVMP